MISAHTTFFLVTALTATVATRYTLPATTRGGFTQSPALRPPVDRSLYNEKLCISGECHLLPRSGRETYREAKATGPARDKISKLDPHHLEVRIKELIQIRELEK